MSTDVIWQTDCTSLEQTLALAADIGRQLRGQETIELISDLGGGKTTFVRGLAKAIGSPDQVSSPTFTLNNVYASPDLTIYHFDFYRLMEPGIMHEELAEVLADPKAVTVIEWADIVEDILPTNRLTIDITATGETSRHFKLSAAAELDYLLEGSI